MSPLADRCRAPGILVHATLLAASLGAAPAAARGAEPPKALQVSRVLFLGDSITHAGHYITSLESRLRAGKVSPRPELINLGLPSETCCGLSEPDHPWPRPNVHERLARALKRVKPDLVFACYGMNDGIYYPFSEERFAQYQKGVRKLIRAVKAAGARLILLTPPPFDPLPLRKKKKLRGKEADKFAWFAIYENYDQEVIARYARFILSLQKEVDGVIDIHTPVTEYVRRRRADNPDFVLSGDGVHLNAEGHEIIARAIRKAIGMQEAAKPDPRLVKLVARRQALLHAAWLSHVEHKRPGVKPGLPLKKAQQQAAAIDAEIAKLGF